MNIIIKDLNKSREMCLFDKYKIKTDLKKYDILKNVESTKIICLK